MGGGEPIIRYGIRPGIPSPFSLRYFQRNYRDNLRSNFRSYYRGIYCGMGLHNSEGDMMREHTIQWCDCTVCYCMYGATAITEFPESAICHQCRAGNHGGKSVSSRYRIAPEKKLFNP